MRFAVCIPRLFAVTLACLSIAHAQQEQQPGLFESLGKLLTPAKQDAPAAEAANPSRNLAVAGKDRRVALVIGNSAYPGAGALRNPANDANDIAAKLKNLGFDVTVRTDMRHKDMLRSLTDFGDKVQAGTEALFFYAGHGMQVRGKNYLLPVDAEIRNEASASSEAVDVDQLLDKLSLARLSVVILDACRNNPFERRFRSGGQGLAQINAPTGTLIAYATAPGKVAADGDGRNGLYTAELLAAMDIPGIKIEDVFKRVRGNVVKKSNDAQTPWESSSLTGDFYFTFQGPTTVNVQQAPARARTPEEIEDSHWDGVKDDREITGFEEYLKQYPTGRYAGQARSKISKLKAESRQPEKVPVVVAPTPAQVASSSTPDNPEAAMWNEVKASGAREYLDAYMKQYPKGKYVALAKVELKKLDERDKAQRAKEATEKQQAAERERQEVLRIEQAAWDEAKAAASVALYTSYLERYPKGRYAALAGVAQQKLQRETVERKQRENEELVAGDLRPGKVFRDCPDCPEMVVIPAGSFEMGSPLSEVGRQSFEDPQHRVNVGTFALGRAHVTRGQFAVFVRETGYDAGQRCMTREGVKWEDRNDRNWLNPGYVQDDSHPAVCLSWADAKAYVEWLSKKTGKLYRLPSEAEWEYAARAGTRTSRFWGDDPNQACDYANLADLTAKANISGASSWTTHDCNDRNTYTAPTRRFKPNLFGLYDMAGNARQWTEDCWHGNYNNAPSDGSIWSGGDCSYRVVRGSAWSSEQIEARSARRNSIRNDLRSVSDIGFRPARLLK